MDALKLLQLNNRSAEEAYAELNKLIKSLEEAKDSLKDEIIGTMTTNGITNNKTEYGEFILAWRKTWEYSTETKQIEFNLKQMKEREENDGTASVAKSTEYIRLVPAK